MFLRQLKRFTDLTKNWNMNSTQISPQRITSWSKALHIYHVNVEGNTE